MQKLIIAVNTWNRYMNQSMELPEGKNRSRKFGFKILLILLVVILSSFYVVFIFHRTSNLESIEQVENAITHAMETGNIEAYLSYFSNNVTIITPDKPSIWGKDALRTSIQSMLTDNNIQVSLTIQDWLLKGDWAFAHVLYQIQLSPKAGGIVKKNRGKELVFFHQVPGKGWRIYREREFNGNP